MKKRTSQDSLLNNKRTAEIGTSQLHQPLYSDAKDVHIDKVIVEDQVPDSMDQFVLQKGDHITTSCYVVQCLVCVLYPIRKLLDGQYYSVE